MLSFYGPLETRLIKHENAELFEVPMASNGILPLRDQAFHHHLFKNLQRCMNLGFSELSFIENAYYIL